MSYRIGTHEVLHASIESAEVDRLLLSASEKVRVLYTDPPWGDGNIKYWATLNRKATGNQFRLISYQQLLDRILQLTKTHVEGHLMFTVGKKWVNMAKTAVEDAGMRNIRVFDCLYKSGSKDMPMLIVYGATSSKYQYDRSKFYPTDETGIELHRGMVSAVAERGKTLFDPCCGMGLLARASLSNGMKFKGSDFNSARLRKTIEFLRAEENKREKV